MCILGVGVGRCFPLFLVRLISLLVICRCLDVRSEPVDPSASSQCLKEIVPHAGYRVSFQELQDFYLVVQINCAGFARARQFSLVIGGKTTSVSECESDLLEVPVRIYRGNLAWKYVVDREDGTVEEREFQFSALPLHEPSISLSFPSPGFSFRKGVPFFFISQLSEQEEAHEFGYPRFFLEISLTSVSDAERFFRFTWGSEKQLSLDNYVQPSQSMVVMEDVDFPVGNYTLNIRLLDGYKQFSGAETSTTVEINQQLDYVPFESDFSVAECQEEGNMDERCGNGGAVEGCGHDMLRDASWLPTIDPLHSIHRCANTLAFTERVEELYKAIDNVVKPVDAARCNSAVRFRGDIASAFGTNVRALLLAIARSMAQQEHLVFEGHWEYLTYRSCPSGHISCYFENVFSCNTSSGRLYERPKSADEVDDPPMDEYRIGVSRVFNLRQNPAMFRAESTFWFLSHAADYILQPNLRMKNLVRQAKAAVNFRSPVIGVHIRQGDSCHAGTGRKCFKTGDYVQAVRNMSDLYGVRTVFVASDNADIIIELRQLHPEVDWLTLPQRRHAGELKGTLPQVINPILRTRMGLIDRRLVAEASLVDLLLLRDCDYFIGQFSSAFSLLVRNITVASPPFRLLLSSF